MEMIWLEKGREAETQDALNSFIFLVFANPLLQIPSISRSTISKTNNYKKISLVTLHIS